jgi:CBS domain-containing protein
MTQLLVEDVVRDRGSDQLYTVPAWATVGDAVDLMAEREIGAVLVMTEDELVGGIFTERDLLMRVVKAGRDARTTPISLVMTREVRFVTPGTTVEAAMALMHLQRHRHLLVMDGPNCARPALDARPGVPGGALRPAPLSGDPLPEAPGQRPGRLTH